MKLTGADIVMECLLEQGVDTVFGYPGGNILHIYDALYRYGDRIRHILTAHEQGASHAADGYARATGRCGVCFATSGPGATNLVTGIATAYMDSSPVVFITGNVPMSMIGKDSFQEADITGITIPVTKNNYIVSDVGELADTLREAFYIARSGRPGPVLVDIPKNVAMECTEFEPQPVRPLPAPVQPDQADVDELVRLLKESERPFLFAGGGVIGAGACAELVALAERVDAPVACSLMGLGAVPHDHPLYTGMLGMHGTKASNRAAAGCDLFVAIGSRFSDRVISNTGNFAKKRTRFVHIDIDRAEINKNILAAHSVVGDAKQVLERVLEKLPKLDHAVWLEKVRGQKSRTVRSRARNDELNPRDMMEAIRAIAGRDALITTEVGQHQIWAAQYYPFEQPGTLITSGGFGTMGFGLGASIGAKVAQPDRPLVHIAGDGSFRMNLNELATVKAYNLPIVTVLVDNGTLGMVRQWQSLFFDGRFSQTTLDRGPDFLKVAEAFGVDGYPVGSMTGFREALTVALENKRPALLHCKVNIDEKVLPMVAPGNAIDEQIFD